MNDNNNIQTINIAEKLISLNVYRNAHHFKLNQIKTDWTKLIKLETIKQKIQPVKKCDLIFTFNFADHRKRDLDNYSATIKFILDGLVHSRILEDDNYKIVRSITILKGKIGKEFVKIEICEVIE